MADEYYLNSTDLGSGGTAFNKQIDDERDSPTTVTVNPAAGDTPEDSYGFSVTTLPGLAQWPTGDWAVTLDVTSADASVDCDIGLTRIDSTYGVLEGPKFTSTEGRTTLDTVQLYTWNFSSISWSSGNSDDRLRIDYRFWNTHPNMAHSIQFLTDTNTLITTPFGVEAFTWQQMAQAQTPTISVPVPVDYF